MPIDDQTLDRWLRAYGPTLLTDDELEALMRLRTEDRPPKRLSPEKQAAIVAAMVDELGAEDVLGGESGEENADLETIKRRMVHDLLNRIAAGEATTTEEANLPPKGSEDLSSSSTVERSSLPYEGRPPAAELSIALSRQDETDSDGTTEWVFRLAPTDERIEYRQGTSQQLSGDLYIRVTWIPEESRVEFSLSGSLGVGPHVNRSIMYAHSAKELETAASFSPDRPDVATWSAEVEASQAPRSGDRLRVDYTDTKTGVAIVVRAELA